MDRLREDWKDKKCKDENVQTISKCPKEEIMMGYDYYNVSITWHGKEGLDLKQFDIQKARYKT